PRDVARGLQVRRRLRQIHFQAHAPFTLEPLPVQTAASLHRQSFFAQIQNHPAAHTVKAGKRRRGHALPQTPPPLGSVFLITFHALARMRSEASQGKCLSRFPCAEGTTLAARMPLSCAAVAFFSPE